MMPNLAHLPEQLQKFKSKIVSTLTTCIEFEREEVAQILPWQSNLRICPYLPLAMQYPKSKSTGESLQFLGQINFAEMPRLADFPEQGILQFYLHMKEWGLGVDESLAAVQDNHRVLYFPEVIEDTDILHTAEALAVADALTDEDDQQLWVEPCRLVNFKCAEQYMTFHDYRFAPLMFGCEQVALSQDYDDLVVAYTEYEKPYTEQFQREGGHRIGGYANYLHATDHRTEFGIEDYMLLMQLDTDEGLEWCDGGIAQWYIHPQDLKQRDFSKVVFLWACH